MKKEFDNITLLFALMILLMGFVSFEYNPVQTMSKNYIQPSHMGDYFDYEIVDNNLIIYNISGVKRVRGSSMQTALFTRNSEIEIVYTNQTLKEGMIVTYENKEGNLILHRIKADYGSQLLVQGDNSASWERINKSQVKYLSIGVLYT